MAFYKDASTYNPLFNQAAAAGARGNQYTVAAAEAFKPGDILNQYVTNRREQEKVDAQLKQQEFANKLAQERVDIATRGEQRTIDKDAAAKKALTSLYGVAADPGQDVYDRQGMFKMNDYLADKFKDTAPTVEQMADIETAYAQGDIDPKFNTDRYRGKLLKTGAEGGMDPSILKSAVDVLAPKGTGKMTDYEKTMLNYNLGVSRDAKKLAAKDVYDKQNKTGSYKDKYGKGFNIEEASYRGLTGKDDQDSKHLAEFWASDAGKAVKKLPKDTQKSLMARWEADYAGESSTLDLTDWVPFIGGSAAGDVLSKVDTGALNKMLEIQQANKPTATTGATATQVAQQQGLLGGKASGQDTLGWLKGRFGDGSKVGGTTVTPTATTATETAKTDYTGGDNKSSLKYVDGSFRDRVTATETKNKDYTSHRKSPEGTTETLGAYQFVPSTLNSLRKQQGDTFTNEEFLSNPKLQDKYFDLLTSQNADTLLSMGMEPNEFNMWAAHNLGPAQAKELMSGGPLSKRTTDYIKRNLPKGVSPTAENYINRYSTRFNRGSDATPDDVPTIVTRTPQKVDITKLSKEENKVYADSLFPELREVDLSKDAPTTEVQEILNTKEDTVSPGRQMANSLKTSGLGPMSESSKAQWKVIGDLLKNSKDASMPLLRDIYNKYQEEIGKPFVEFINEYAPGGRR